MRLFTTRLASLAIFIATSQAVLDNYALLDGGGAVWINKLRDIKATNHWIVKRPWGAAPQHCVATAKDNAFCNPENFEIFDIYYADCHAPWVVCRCNTSPSAFPIETIAENIGKIPVRARSWVRHYSFYPVTSTWNGAYATGNDINVFGEYSVSTILFHETCHNLDYWLMGNAQGFWSRTSTEWQGLAAQDSCVPTNYAKSSWAEHFAEVCVNALYEENFGNIPVSTQCMTKTLTKARTALRSAIKIVPGDLCNERMPPSTPICMGPNARAQGACNGVPDSI